MNQNGKHTNVAVVDTLETATRAGDGTAFHDPSDPTLQPPKEVETKKRGTWKRKLMGWAFVLLLIGGGIVALYLLLRVQSSQRAGAS